MTNPFENPEGRFFVLVNDEGQHSLWPAFVEVPPGWTAVHGETTRDSCVEYVNENWTDMRPTTLVRAMAGTAS